MKKIVLGLSLAAMAAAGAAYAQPGMRPNPDTDGNGVVTRAEAQAHAGQMFAMMDANKDGKLDQADRAAHRAQMFDRMDADHDGKITRAEFDAMHQGGPGDRMGMGKDGDKGWSMKRGHYGRGDMARMADTNKDGAVSQAEFTAAALQRFDRTDTNKDGQVTKEERQAARAAMREQWQQRKADGQGPGPMGN